MEQTTDALRMLDLMARPAFCVKDGIIFKTNPAAAACLIEEGTEVIQILQTGVEEYAQFPGGCLFLTLSVYEKNFGASVTRMQEFDVFCMEQDAPSRELQAMALAARELREPLASVMLAMERLFPSAYPSASPTTRNQMAQINRRLFQMLRIIGNMSDANRYVSDTGSHQEVREICGILAESFDRAAVLVEKAGAVLQYSGLPEPVYGLVDAEKIERAVFNMLSNAVKFTPQGGVIHAKLTRRGNKLYLSVTDNGPGIDESLRGCVFTRYTRDAEIEDGRFGIGLGMVLIRTAAALHGGAVLVDHPNGAGTRITMTIAIRPGDGRQLHAPTLQVDYAGERDHGLIEFSDVLPPSAFDSQQIN